MNAILYIYIQSVLSLSDQLGMFKDYIMKLKGTVDEERRNNILSNSLFLVVAGSVDLCYSYYTTGVRKTQYSVASYANLMVTSASNFLQVFFLFLPVNPKACHSPCDTKI